MMQEIARGMILLFVAGGIWAQGQGARPAFEAAVVKVNNSGSPGSSSNGSRGQVVFTNQTLKRLVERAYNVKPFQVTGPGWMESIRFDISAKYPRNFKEDDRFLMLRGLLEERFKLAAHRESKDMPGYALTVAKSGFKLKPVESGGGSDTSTNGAVVKTLTAKGTSIAFLAELLARNLGEMVVDRTGIEGVYDFELRWTNEDQSPPPADAEPAPFLFTALQEKLGLRLQPQKVPVEIIVVDHVERAPVEN